MVVVVVVVVVAWQVQLWASALRSGAPCLLMWRCGSEEHACEAQG